jgi:hypothetical protein
MSILNCSSFERRPKKNPVRRQKAMSISLSQKKNTSSDSRTSDTNASRTQR